ncbi:MAG: ribonuclease HIII [Chthoniobacterales bacterium]
MTSYTKPLTAPQVEALRTALEKHQFDFEEKPYTHFAARKGKLTVACYQKGPKVLLQGKGLEDFISFILEPEVLGSATFGYEEELDPELLSPHFGIDESGKGDFFGPLVIAGCYTDEKITRHFRELGIADSKTIKSDQKIRTLAAAIRKSKTAQTVILINPERYNALFDKIGNLNRLLAWGHARAIENLCELQPDCPRALSDKFAHVSLIQRSLMDRGKKLQLDQRTKAESDPAVAAASILAREKFIDWLASTGERLGTKLPRGASAQVKATATDLVRQHGPDVLPTLAKVHFKTAAEVLDSL